MELGATPSKYVFLDVIGFTDNRSVEDQASIIKKLNTIVLASLAAYKIAAKDVICLPTGDGICICLLNTDSPFDIHLKIAIKITRLVDVHNKKNKNPKRRFTVRIGINANTDNLVLDINKRRNLAGEGINKAARIMSIADGGQILISDMVFETLKSRQSYLSCFRELEAKVKHDLSLSVFQLIKGKYRGLNTSLPAMIESEILSKKELLSYDGDIYDEFCSMLHDAVREIYIVVNEREWVFRLALSIINALRSGIQIYVRYYPSENKESHKIQFLRDLGCKVTCAKVGQPPPFLGVIADPNSENSAKMLIYITNPGRHRVKARVYRGPVDFAVIRSTYLHAVEERILPSAPDSQRSVPRIERISIEEMIEALRKTKIYRNCKIKAERINPENTRPIATAIKAYKIRQIHILRKMLRESKLKCYEPAAVIYSRGKKKLLVPPVLESHSVGLCVAEGHTRLHQSIQEGDKKIIAMVVYGVSKPFPSSPMIWDDVTIDRREISSGGIVYDTTLIRDIEKWVHWEGELPH